MASGRRQYPFHLIEPKWQNQWEQQETFRAWNPGETVPANHPFAERHSKAEPEQLPKFYILDMFPYPSGAGLHVGHPEGYTATDILARYRRALGYNVLHPIGWDAFGLPAEQYAIKTGQHPRKTTEQNIATFKRQIKSLGFSYDWTPRGRYHRPRSTSSGRSGSSCSSTTPGSIPRPTRPSQSQTLPYPPELQSEAGVPTAELEQRRRAYRDSKRLAYVYRSPRLVVRATRHGARQRRSRGRQERGRRLPGRAQADAPVDAPHHRLRRAPVAGPGHHRLERFAQGNAAQLDWPLEGAEVDFRVPDSSRGHPRVHHPAGHAVWRDLHGAGARA